MKRYKFLDDCTKCYPRSTREAFGDPQPAKSTDYSTGWWVAICLIAAVALYLAITMGPV